MTDWMLVLLPLLAVPIVLLFRFIGCGQLLSTSDDTEVEAWGFTVTPALDKIDVNQAGSATLTVTVTPKGGYNKPVNLEVSALAKVDLSFSPTTVSSGSYTSALTVKPANDASVGASDVVITGRGKQKDPPPPAQGAPPPPPPGDISATAKLTINTTVAAPAVGDFTLVLSPLSQQVTPPNSVTYNVAINRTGGFAEAVDLSILVNSVEQAAGTFNPDPAPGASSIFTAASAGAMTGTYTIRVRGRGTTSGTTRESNNATLTVV